MFDYLSMEFVDGADNDRNRNRNGDTGRTNRQITCMREKEKVKVGLRLYMTAMVGNVEDEDEDGSMWCMDSSSGGE